MSVIREAKDYSFFFFLHKLYNLFYVYSTTKLTNRNKNNSSNNHNSSEGHGTERIAGTSPGRGKTYTAAGWEMRAKRRKRDTKERGRREAEGPQVPEKNIKQSHRLLVLIYS